MRDTRDPRRGGKYRLEDRQAMTLRRLSKSSRLYCVGGTLWVTVKGDHTDHLVREGERFPLGARKPVISAIGAAEFYVLTHRPGLRLAARQELHID